MGKKLTYVSCIYDEYLFLIIDQARFCKGKNAGLDAKKQNRDLTADDNVCAQSSKYFIPILFRLLCVDLPNTLVPKRGEKIENIILIQEESAYESSHTHCQRLYY